MIGGGPVETYNDNTGSAAHAIDVIMPPSAPAITSDFDGIDIFHEPGTPIISAADGVVVKSEVGTIPLECDGVMETI